MPADFEIGPERAFSMSRNDMACKPDIRCRHFVRLQDIPPLVRLGAVAKAVRMYPDETPENLMAAALYPDPDHGEWVAESLEDHLAGMAA